MTVTAAHAIVPVQLGPVARSAGGLGRADWDLSGFGDDVVAVVRDVGAPRVALVGHPMGGDAVVFAARQLGTGVAGIVWVDVLRSLGDEPVSPPEVVDAFVAPFREDFTGAVDAFARSLFPTTADPALVDRVAGDMAAVRREGTLGSLGHALNRHPPILAVLAQITAPVVAINPDIGPTDVDSLRRHGVEPIVLEGVGHFLMLEDPDRFNAVLASTLESFEHERLRSATGDGPPGRSDVASRAVVSVRPLRVGDGPEWHRVFASVAAEGRWIGAEAPVPDLSAAWLRPYLDEPDHVLLLAEDEGEVIGWITADVDATGSADLGMGVLDGFRGRGIGWALMEAVREWAVDRGVARLHLSVFPHNERAIALYQRCGFVVTERQVAAWRRRDGERWDLLVMERST